MAVIALIGSLREAQDLPERAATRERLRATCSQLNEWRQPLGLAASFTLTRGDRFQALFGQARGLWHCLFAIESALKPARLRFGVGVGEVEGDIDPAAAIGLDGPALDLAREALEGLERDGGSYRVLGLGPAQELARHALDLMSATRDSWRPNRVDIFHFLLNGKSPAHMARALGISEQAVYKNIRQGRLETLQGLCRGVGRLLDDAVRG
jgi:hypothetical protein